MPRSALRYLGLLGLLGLLGVPTGNPGFYGFFGAFGFFAFGRLRQDERLAENINRAGRNAFVVSVLLFALGAVLSVFLPPATVYAVGFAVTFGVQMIVFSISLVVYEGRDGDGAADAD